MKRMISVLLTLALLLCGMAALAEDSADAAGLKIDCAIEDGAYVIRIPEEDEDLGWYADDMSQDDSVVKLASAEHVDGEFVVRYEPVGDGEMTVAVKHYYTSCASDEVFTWDLVVKDGAVQECTGGSHEARPDEAEVDPHLSGEWLEEETQFTQLTIEKNADRGWDVEIAAPLTHGAYVFRANICYDCDADGFIYDKGKFWEVPITDGESAELGEAAVAGTTGVFAFAGDEENPRLTWVDDQHPDQQIVFVPAAE